MNNMDKLITPHEMNVIRELALFVWDRCDLKINIQIIYQAKKATTTTTTSDRNKNKNKKEKIVQHKCKATYEEKREIILTNLSNNICERGNSYKGRNEKEVS